jgi:hypothetical protein
LATISTASVLEGYLNGVFAATSAAQSVTAGTNINLSIFGTLSSTTNGIYPGMAITSVGGIPANTYVTEVTATTFKLSQSTSSVTSWVGMPNLFMTEYGVLETAGTITVFSAAINTIAPYNIQLTGTASYSAAVGTAVKTLYRMEKELLELY